MSVHKKEPTDSREAILRSAVALFLEKGFTRATAQAISENAGMTTGGMFNYYDSIEAVLYEIIGLMFKNQFSAAEKLLPANDPAMLYGMETALQLHIAELNEALRDVYVAAYSLPTTVDLIHKMTTKRLYSLFSASFPEYCEKDFYEMEIGTAGLMRGYMARPCDMYFTLDKKINRFFETAMSVYRIPKEKQKEVFSLVQGSHLRETALQMVETAIAHYSGNADAMR